jgi:ATP-dependent Lhr-like helicase
LERLSGCSPRRIGLSATVGDGQTAAEWLRGDSSLPVLNPPAAESKRKLAVGMAYFPEAESDETDHTSSKTRNTAPELYAWLYAHTLGKQALVFTRSRMEAEQTALGLRNCAALAHSPDVYRVHHGSLSAALREDTEREMKTGERQLVTCATVTLELGIDIGSLDCIAQIGAPPSVSSLAQRVGRSGRKGQRAELLFAAPAAGNHFNKTQEEAESDLLSAIDFDFIKSIAMLRLYLQEKWIEPAPIASRKPFGLLYHQTLAILIQNGGGLSAPKLAKEVLTLPAFAQVTQEEYKILLQNMLERGHLQREDGGLLLVGNAADQVVNSKEFYAVFAASEEYSVHAGQGVIGTVSQSLAPDDFISLGGKTWKVVRLDETRKALFVEPAPSASVPENRWESGFRGELHARVAHAMRNVLFGSELDAFLSPLCRTMLTSMRETAKQLGLLNKTVVTYGMNGCAILPWLGSAQLLALQAILKTEGIRTAIAPGGFTPIYLDASGNTNTEHRLRQALYNIKRTGIQKEGLPLPSKPLPFSKYDRYVPSELLDVQMREEIYDVDFLIDA